MSPTAFTSPLILLAFALDGVAIAQPGKGVDRHGDPLPPGAIARMGTTRFRHELPVRYVHYSSDGKILLGEVADDVNTDMGSRLWLAGLGKPLPQFAGKVLGSSTALSSDGTLLVDLDGNGVARLWDIATGTILHTFGEVSPGKKHKTSPEKEETWKVSWASFARDGKVLVLYGTQKGKETKEVLRRFQLSHIATLERLEWKELRAHDFSDDTNQYSFAISPDAKTLAYLGSLVDLDTGKKKRTLEDSDRDSPISFEFTPDGKTLIGYGFETSIWVWDVANGKLLRTIEGGKHGFRVRQNFIAPDSKWIAVNDGNDHSVSIYELATGKLQWCANNNRGLLNHNLFSPDSKLVASASDGASNICVSEVATGKKLCTFDFLLGQSQYGGQMAFSPDGKRLAFGSGRLIRIGDIATGKLIDPGAGHDECPAALFFSRDGKILSTAGTDTGICDWDPAIGRELKRFPEVKKWAALCLPRDGSILAAVDNHWSVWFRDVRAGKDLRAFNDTPDGSGRWYRKCAFSADGSRVATAGYDSDVYVFDVANGKKISQFPWYSEPPGKGPWTNDTPLLAFSPDGRTLAGFGESRPLSVPVDSAKPHVTVVRIWELATGKERKQIRFESGTAPYRAWMPSKNGHFAWLPPFRFSPDNKTFTIATADALYLYSIATGNEVRRFSRPGLIAVGAVVSADGSLVAAPDQRGRIHVWQTDTATLLRTFECGPAHATLLAFSPDCKRLASAHIDGIVMVWDLEHFLKKEAQGFNSLPGTRGLRVAPACNRSSRPPFVRRLGRRFGELEGLLSDPGLALAYAGQGHYELWGNFGGFLAMLGLKLPVQQREKGE